MAKSTGGGGSIYYNGATIPYKSYTPTVEKEHDDSTDSTNYDQASGLVHKSQLAVSTQTTFEIEGVIDLAIIPLGIVLALYSNPGALPASFKYNTSTTYGHGNVDLTNFKATLTPTNTLTYTATMITNGVFTPNS